ncbi:MAG: hypothetical protein ACQESR_05980 [Planctomycetota bacterium]
MLPAIILSYIDPMSGAVVLQLILAGLIATVAFFRRSIAGIFRKVFRMKGDCDSNVTGK